MARARLGADLTLEAVGAAQDDADRVDVRARAVLHGRQVDAAPAHPHRARGAPVGAAAGATSDAKSRAYAGSTIASQVGASTENS